MTSPPPCPPPAPLSPAGLETLAQTYLADQRKRTDGQPWVLMNMVTSVDGAIAIAGRSGGLGGPADHRIFRILRSLADVILVGAGTVRAEGYGPPQLGQELKAMRVERGQTPLPRIAVVTKSLRLAPDLKLFSNPDLRPLVVTTTNADAEAVDAVSSVADVVSLDPAADGGVDLNQTIDQLASDGTQVILSEGGPSLNGHLLAADRVDEIDWTISPLVVGGNGGRMVAGPHMDPRAFALERAVPVDGMLFCRYLRSDDD